jgi:hypothetical protein
MFSGGFDPSLSARFLLNSHNKDSWVASGQSITPSRPFPEFKSGGRAFAIALAPVGGAVEGAKIGCG